MNDDQVYLMQALLAAAWRLHGWRQTSCETRADGSLTITFAPIAEAPRRRLCAHANDGQPMHWLEPGEQCDR